MTTKQEVINDESKFQRVCKAFVERNVIQCVSSLISDIGKNIEAACKMFDLDYDEVIGWFQKEDYEEAVSDFIRNDADLDQLEWIADNCGYWSDVIEGAGYGESCDTVELDGDPDDFDDWLSSQDNACKKKMRESVLDLVSTPEEYREVAQEYGLEPYTVEVFEHWLCSDYLINMLQCKGEVVFEFAGMQIWGRCTTGQSISVDGVIRQCIKELDDDHYIWGEG